MKKNRLTVSIVLPNWNGEKLLVKNLPKVIAASEGAEVIVVDDCSTDASVGILKSKFPSVRTIVKDSNSGFSRSVNVGVAHARGDIIVLLNTDVVPEDGFIMPLLKHFSDPTIFGVGCLEKNPGKDGVVLRGRGVAHWEKGFFIHARGEVDKSDTAWVAGGSGAFRRSLWNKLGSLDTIYSPFYWEDIDLSYRALKSGYNLVFEPKSVVWHFHEQGSIKTQFQEEQVQKIVYRNQFIFVWKNLTNCSLWLQHVIWVPIRIVQELLKGDTTMFIGLALAIGKITYIAAKRSTLARLWKKDDATIFVD